MGAAHNEVLEKGGRRVQKGNEKRVIEIIRDIEKIVKQLKDTAND